MTRATLYLGDCREVMAAMPENSVDAIVCDPPYGLSKEPDAAEVLRHWLAGDDYVHSGSGFMGKSWDSFVPGPAVWREAFRVLKPGGHLLAFAGSRTLDLMGIAIRMAGFEIRDTLSYLYGSGFPKSLNVSKAIDKAAGVKGSDAAQAWNGWGTALKPSYEPIVMARKPLIGTVAKNVLEHGTGAINIDACRIGTAEDVPSVKAVRASDYPQSYKGDGQPGWGRSRGGRAGDEVNWSPTAGRWPANTLLSHDEDCVLVGTRKVKSDGHYPSSRPGTTTITTDGHAGQEGLEERYTSGEEVEAWECTEDCPVRLLDEQSGERKTGAVKPYRRSEESDPMFRVGEDMTYTKASDGGGASRFFYSSKASKKERNAGLPDLPSLGQAAPMGQTSKVRQCNQCGSRSKSADPSKPHPTCGHDDWSLVEQKGDHKGKVLNDHPTVKPIGVMAWLVKLVTPPGGVVLDPFMGSGSTGCAAAQEGFDFIGCDIDPHYLAIAAYRIQHHGAEQIMAHVVEPSPEPIPEVEAQPEPQPAPEPVAEPEPEPEPEPLIEPDEVEVDEDDGPEPVEFDGADTNLGPRPKGLAPHPAEWSGAVLGVLGALIPEGVTVLDPMAGTGWRLEEALPGRTLVGVELEPEWAEGASWVQQGDARNLPFADGTFSWVVTSPCLEASEKVLTADLRWVEAGSVRVGDRLLAFDEFSSGTKANGHALRRKYQVAEVTQAGLAQKQCVRVTMENGDSVVCSWDHPWLARRYAYGDRGPAQWVRACDLMRSDGQQPWVVLKQFDPWEEDRSYEAGWLAGMLDGEGSLHFGQHGSPKLQVSQNVGPVAEQVERWLLDLGHKATTYLTRDDKMARVYIGGGMPDILRALGELRPMRLIAKFDSLALNSRTIQPRGIRVAAVEEVGEQTIATITTSTGTYIGQGYLHHNTYANRMSDSHNAQERCKPCEATGRVGDEICERCDGQGRRAYKRLTYTHRLGRPLSEGSTANLGWIGKEGERYREAHEAIWAEVWRVMAAGGIFLLNVKNHYRTTTKGEPPEEMKVVEWHRDTCLALGFDLIEDYLVKAPGMRFGANRDVRAEHEHVLVLGKPVGPSTSPANG